ncbi:MAG: Gp37-like protein [Ktedonobacteraceae bacterium]
MELYTLTNHFFLNKQIQNYISLIWTERYSSAGDVQLVIPPTLNAIKSLAPGTFLAINGSKEIMVVDTQTIEKDLMTVTGSSLIKFLNQRIAWFENPDYDASATTPGPMFADYTSDDFTVGEFISNVVNEMLIVTPNFYPPYDAISLDQARDKIPNLTLGNVDGSGGSRRLTFPIGPLYDGITQIASAHNLGIKMFLESAHFNSGAYSLKFSTYHGRDRTSDQTNNNIVRFAPEFDNLNNPKEVRSNDQFKNVVYVVYKNTVTPIYPRYMADPPVGFLRRVTKVDAPDIHLTADHIPPFLARVGNTEITKDQEIYTIDGEVLNEPEYKFGVAYNLGDFVEVKGYSGLIVKARVVEHIRSQDQYGERRYPTFNVVSVLDTTFDEDLAYTPEWTDNPTYTGDTPPDTGVADLPDRELMPLPMSTAPAPTGLRVSAAATTFVQTGDWFYDTNRGYYSEDGIVYLAGAAVAGVNGTTFSYPGSEVLVSGLPTDMTPDTDTASRVMIDPLNSSEHFANGGWLPITVHPDGSITLDNGNPAPSIPSSPGLNDYAIISLFLSGISWPVGNGVPVYTPNSTFSTGDLMDEVDGWSNVNAKYVSRATRFHFKGVIEAGSLANENAPVRIPAALCPANLPEPLGGSPDEAFHWCAVVTNSGYAFQIGPRDGLSHPMFFLGSVNGQTNSFYAKTHDGTGHGTETTLSFTPGQADIGVDYNGYSGAPSTTLPASSDWRGTSYSATVNFNVSDLIDIWEGPAGAENFPVEHAEIAGNAQFAFIMGIMPGMNAYYKVTFTYDSIQHKVWLRLIQEACGDVDEREQLSFIDLEALIEADGNVSFRFAVDFSTDPSDFNIVDPIDIHPGYDYFRIRCFDRPPFSDVAGSTFTGSAIPPAWPGAKGDMGVHIPPGSSIEVFSSSIEGIGTFQPFSLGDRIDLTGGGWPL